MTSLVARQLATVSDRGTTHTITSKFELQIVYPLLAALHGAIRSSSSAVLRESQVMIQLILQSRGRARHVEWSQYALLRDNVQHYLEFGQPQNSFTALHGLERAVDGGRGRIRARELRQEVQGAWDGLAELKLEQSAVSLRTRAIMTGCDQAPQVRGTVVARLAGWDLPVHGPASQPIRELLRGFVDVVLSLTEDATDDDELTVACEDRPSARSLWGALG
jgi:hypothetical protein